MDISAIEAFLNDAKRLRGVPPEWQQSPRPSEYEATWGIEDSIGALAGQLRFRCPKAYRASPSISVVVRGSLVTRVDLTPPEWKKLNPPDAGELGLPARVAGSHAHLWADNRDWVLKNERFGQLPYRRPIPPQIRRLPQAMLWLATEINLTIGPDQRGFDIPAQADLF